MTTITRCDVTVFVAQVLYSLSLVRAWEIRYAVGIPTRVKVTWFWQGEKYEVAR